MHKVSTDVLTIPAIWIKIHLTISKIHYLWQYHQAMNPSTIQTNTFLEENHRTPCLHPDHTSYCGTEHQTHCFSPPEKNHNFLQYTHKQEIWVHDESTILGYSDFSYFTYLRRRGIDVNIQFWFFNCEPCSYFKDNRLYEPSVLRRNVPLHHSRKCTTPFCLQFQSVLPPVIFFFINRWTSKNPQNIHKNILNENSCILELPFCNSAVTKYVLIIQT